MKRKFSALLALFYFLFSPVFAAETSSAEADLQGWVQEVDYSHGRILLMDERGFKRRVMVRRGTIGDYRHGDHVRVTLDPDREWMNTVEKI